MRFKSHSFFKFAMIFSLAAALSACAPGALTGTSQATSAPNEAATLPPEATPTPSDEATPLPSFTPEPTQEPAAPSVDLSAINSFYRLDMVDASSGWAVTNLGLLRTTDGGYTWQLADPPHVDPAANPLGAYFTDANDAYLLAPVEDYASGTLYHTSDGGQNWSVTDVPFAMGAFQFVDTQMGFFMASLGVGAGSNPVAFYQTEDGGLTWQKLFSTLDQQTATQESFANGGIKSGFTMLDAQHGWVAGSIPMDNFVYLFATSDGALTWQHQEVPIPADLASGFYSPDAPIFLTPATVCWPYNRPPATAHRSKRCFSPPMTAALPGKRSRLSKAAVHFPLLPPATGSSGTRTSCWPAMTPG